ncbi:MAG: energy transducer TonB [Pirellulaceae bacterium]|nr:energy transducer TonB [Pirellulaceae bacterium]
MATPCRLRHAMPLKLSLIQFSLLASSLAHFGLVAGLWLWRSSVQGEPVEYTVDRGEAAAMLFVSPSAQASVVVSLEAVSDTEPSEPPVAQRPPALAPSPSELRRPDVPLELVSTEATWRPSPEVPVAREATAQRVDVGEQRPDVAKEPVSTVRLRRPTPAARRLPEPLAAAIPVRTVDQAGAQVDVLPRKLASNAPPQYPVQALLGGQEGRVLIRVLVGADGRAERASIFATSGHALLDAAALDAVLRWRFEPARGNGRAVAHEVVVPVRFSIRDA